MAARAVSSRGLPVRARPAGAAATGFFSAISIITLDISGNGKCPNISGNGKCPKFDVDSCPYHRNDTYGIET
jgi:hypothetical protein